MTGSLVSVPVHRLHAQRDQRVEARRPGTRRRLVGVVEGSLVEVSRLAVGVLEQLVVVVVRKSVGVNTQVLARACTLAASLALERQDQPHDLRLGCPRSARI